MAGTYFITGIDTDIGKTFCTGLLARWLLEQGHSVITSKPVQTGCTDVSEDIVAHRKMMGCALFPEDKQGKTCGYLFAKPCSPHLAAELAGIELDLSEITRKNKDLATDYRYLLVEGAGGLYAPLRRDTLTVDYVQAEKLPLILVSSSRLGSLHHTIALFELIKNRGICLSGVIYNRHAEVDQEIGDDSLQVLKAECEKLNLAVPFVEVGSSVSAKEVDFSPLFMK